MTTPRPLRPVTGGTRARDVDALRSALAALLADPAGRGRTRGPVLVPVAPGEDAAALLARIEAAGPLPSAADLVLRTSGSTTGSGALIAISAAALTASARATRERLGAAGTWVLALPAHHIAGLQVLTRSLLAEDRKSNV